MTNLLDVKLNSTARIPSKPLSKVQPAPINQNASPFQLDNESDKIEISNTVEEKRPWGKILAIGTIIAGCAIAAYFCLRNPQKAKDAAEAAEEALQKTKEDVLDTPKAKVEKELIDEGEKLENQRIEPSKEHLEEPKTETIKETPTPKVKKTPQAKPELKPIGLEGGKPLDGDDARLIYNNFLTGRDDDKKGVNLINATLKDNFEETRGKNSIKTTIQMIDRIIESSTPLKDEFVVYRAAGMDKEYKEALQVGKIFNNKGYTSTSMTTDSAYSKIFGGKEGINYLMRIMLPKGTKGLNMRRYPHTLINKKIDEFLLPRGAAVKILSIDAKNKLIEAQYLLPQK